MVVLYIIYRLIAEKMNGRMMMMTEMVVQCEEEMGGQRDILESNCLVHRIHPHNHTWAHRNHYYTYLILFVLYIVNGNKKTINYY